MSDINRPECRSRVNQRVITNSDVQLVQDARTKYPPRRPPSIQYSWATFLWQQLLTALLRVAKTEPDRSEESQQSNPQLELPTAKAHAPIRRSCSLSSQSLSSHTISSHSICLLDNLTVGTHNPSLRPNWRQQYGQPATSLAGTK
jgi:hypothetical protein